MKRFLPLALLSLVFASSLQLEAAAADATVEADSAAPLNGLSSSLTLYVYPARSRLDWSTPETTLRTMLGNLIGVVLSSDKLVQFISEDGEPGSVSSRYKSSMGHTLAHIQCQLPNGKLYDHWASFSGQNFVSEDKRMILKEKVGMGALFHNYIDGHIIKGIENVKRITHYKGGKENGERIRPRYMQYELDAARCAKIEKMVSFFESFNYPAGSTFEQLKARPELEQLYFTSVIDPFDSYNERIKTGKGQVGGGCAPFGAALVKAAGLYKPEFETLWRQPVTVSEKLIGHQYDPRYKNDPVMFNDPRIIQRVSLDSILHSKLGDKWTWDEEGFPNRHLSLYDPQKIWDFSGDVLSCLSGRNCTDGAAKMIGGEKGKMQLGVTQIFRDTVVIEYRKHNGESAGQGEKIPEHVEQPVKGFVWRLR